MLLGQKKYFLDEVDSTNSYAARLAAEGEPEGTVVVADYQTAGRGRLGRRWVSPRGLNIYMSVILRPGIAPLEAPLVTLAAGVALAKSVRGMYGLDAGLKWPNDLMVGGKKAAGILTEMSASADKVRYVVLGVGVDVNMAIEDFPDDIRGVSTSVMIELGRKADKTELMGRFLEELGRVYGLLVSGGKGALLKEWRSNSCTLGQAVSVSVPGGTIKGRAVDVDEYGRLVLELPGGGLESVSSGDLVIGP